MPEHEQIDIIPDRNAIAQGLRLRIEQDLEAEAMSRNTEKNPNKDIFVNGAEKPVSIPKESSIGVARQTEMMESSDTIKSYYGGRESLTEDDIAYANAYPMMINQRGQQHWDPNNNFLKTTAEFLGAKKKISGFGVGDLGSWINSVKASYKYKIPAQMMLELANETEEARSGPSPFSHEWFEEQGEGTGGMGEVLATSLKGAKDVALRVEGETTLPAFLPHGGMIPTDMLPEVKHSYGLKIQEIREASEVSMDKYRRAGLREGWLDPENRTMIHVLGDTFKSIAEFVGITYAFGGNPMAGASYFSALQQLDSYQEALDGGMKHEEAVEIANVKAFSTFVFSAGGGAVLYKGLSEPSKSLTKQILKGAVAEGIPEAGESISHDLIDVMYGMGPLDFGEIATDASRAFSLGAIGGGVVSGGAKSIQDSRVKGRLLDANTQERSAGLLAQGLIEQRAETIDQARSRLIKESPIGQTAIFEGPLQAGDIDPVLTLLDEMLDMITTQGEIMEDSMVPDSEGGPKTAPGKEAKRLRAETTKLVEAFLKLEGIEPVMSKAQKMKFETDTINRMRGMMEVERAIGLEGAIKDIETKAKVLSGKMDALEAKGEGLLKKESGKVDSEGINYPVFVESDSKEAQKLRKDYEALSEEISQLAKTRNDILNKSGLLEDDLLEGQTVSEKLGRLVSIRKRAEIKALTKGMKAGEVFDKKRLGEIASAVTKVIDSMPISKAGKNALKKGIPSIHRASDLDLALDLLAVRAVNTFVKEQTKSNIGKINGAIKKNKTKNKGKTNNAKFNTMLDDISKMSKSSAKELIARDAQEVKDELSSRYDSGELADMHMDYAHIKAKGDKAGLIATTGFLDNLNFLIELNYLPTELSVERQAQIFETLRKADTGKLLSDIDLKRQDTVFSNPLKRVMSGFANWAMTTYHTKLVKLGLHNDKTFNTEQGEMNARDGITRGFERLISINEKVGLDVDKDMAKWNDPDNDYKEPNDLSNDEVSDWVLEAGSLETAKAIAKKYLVKDKALREEVDLAEDIEEVVNIVSRNEIAPKTTDDHMSKAEAIYKYALLQNKDIRRQMMDPLGEDAMTQSRVDALEASIGEKEKAWVKEIFAFMKDMHTRLKPFWERKFGVVMPEVENYMPVRRNPKVKKDAVVDPSNLDMFGESAYLGDLTPGFSKSRTETNARVKNADALQVVEDYLREAEWFMNMGEQIDAMNAVMGHRDFENHMTQRLGVDGYDSFKNTVKQYQREGGLPDPHPAPKVVRWAHTAFLRYALGFKPQIGIKQTSSLFGFMEEVPTEYFLLRLSQTPLHMARWREELREHSTIKNRGRHFDHEWSIMRGDNKLGAYGQKNKIGEASVFFGRMGDVTAIYIGGGIMFDYLTQERGLSKEEALRQIASKTEQSQQSTLQMHKTPLQASNNPMIKMIGMFKTSPTAQNNMIAKSYYRWKRGEITNQQFAKSVYIYHVMIPSIFAWMSLGLIPDDTEQLKALLLGNIGGVPVAGDVMSFMAGRSAEGLTGGDVKSFPLGRKMPLEELFSEGIDTFGTLKDYALSEGEVTEMELIQSTADLLGFFSSTGAGNLVEMSQGMYGVVEHNEYQDWQKLMGVSEGTIEQGLESENK